MICGMDDRPPKSRRRWLRFSLRALLVFLLLLSVPLAWFAWRMQEARRQGEAVEAIVGMGGEVTYNYQIDEHGEWIPGAEPTTPAWLRKSLGHDFFYDVTWVSFDGTQATDAGLEHLKGLTCLEVLWLGDTKVTDAGLEHLKGLTNLEVLSLGYTQVTDAGLEHLKGLVNLRELDLFQTQVTDAGLVYLKEMAELRQLHLGATRLTDAGLRHLAGLTNLKRLWLNWEIPVTHDGVEELRRALPNCEIIGP
jgi:hypothetical protein